MFRIEFICLSYVGKSAWAGKSHAACIVEAEKASRESGIAGGANRIHNPMLRRRRRLSRSGWTSTQSACRFPPREPYEAVN
jgi:hypothetical protein